jgi:hypothetical protein
LNATKRTFLSRVPKPDANTWKLASAVQSLAAFLVVLRVVLLVPGPLPPLPLPLLKLAHLLLKRPLLPKVLRPLPPLPRASNPLRYRNAQNL